jgi:hypothetical protein
MNDPDLDQLLQRARLTAPPAGRQHRLRSRILAGAAAAGLGTVAARAVATSKASAVVAASAKSSGPLLSVLACVGGGVAVGLLVIGPALSNHRQSARPHAAQVVVVTEPSVPVPETATPPEQTTLPATSADLARSRNPPGSPPRSTSAAPHLPSIERETALLAEAQRALGRSDAAAALRVLDAYDREFPAGALAEEALAARAVSWCSLGRRSEGLRALEAFRTAYAASPLLARVTAACSKISSHENFEPESPPPRLRQR